MEENKGGGLSWEKSPSPKAPIVATSTPAGEISNRSWLTGVFIAGLVLGALVIWGWSAVNPRGGTAGPASSDTTNTAALSGSTAAGVLTVPGLQEAGLAVMITSAVVSLPTWVVVYESRGGQPGNALGASLFESGRSSGSINLLRGMLSGQTYFVGERRDNGDRIFSLESDREVLDQNNKPVLAQFKTR